MPIRVQLIVVVALIALGGLVLSVPGDSEGSVLVPISPGHGLSVVDLVGATLLSVGATWLEVLLIWRLPDLRLGGRTLFGLGLLAGFGLGLLIAAVYLWFWWWAVGAGLCTVALAVLTVRAFTVGLAGRTAESSSVRAAQ